MLFGRGGNPPGGICKVSGSGRLSFALTSASFLIGAASAPVLLPAVGVEAEVDVRAGVLDEAGGAAEAELVGFGRVRGLYGLLGGGTAKYGGWNLRMSSLSSTSDFSIWYHT